MLHCRRQNIEIRPEAFVVVVFLSSMSIVVMLHVQCQYYDRALTDAAVHKRLSRTGTLSMVSLLFEVLEVPVSFLSFTSRLALKTISTSWLLTDLCSKGFRNQAS